jgi:hypothetical protein
MTALNRRCVLRSLFLGAIANLSLLPFMAGRNVATGATDSDLLRVRWRIPQGQLKRVQDRLRDFDGEITGDPLVPEDARGLPVIYLLVGTTFVSYLADALMAVYRDIKYGGLIIQAKPNGEFDIQNDRRLAGSTIIVKTPDGVEFYRTRSAQTSTELIDVLTKLRQTLPR